MIMFCPGNCRADGVFGTGLLADKNSRYSSATLLFFLFINMVLQFKFISGSRAAFSVYFQAPNPRCTC